MTQTKSPRSLRQCSALAWLLATAAIPAAHGQGVIPSGTMTGVAAGGNLYDYTLTVSDSGSASSSIGSVWFAWVPGQFYLVSTPSSLQAPTGWTETIVGKSIQLNSTSSIYDIAPGGTETFGFVSADSPSVMYGNSVSHPSTPIGTSVAYAAEGFSGNNVTFVLTPTPEPSTLALIAVGAGGLFLTSRRLRLARN